MTQLLKRKINLLNLTQNQTTKVIQRLTTKLQLNLAT